MEIKHSVLVVTYNQEKYIGACLESLKNQTVQPYEVIVLDDCSTDSNWKIIQSYANEYPNLFRCYRNKINIGLLKNFAKIKKLYRGNVVSYCSGDDLLQKQTIEIINNKFYSIEKNPEKEKILVISNSIHLYPNGRKTLWNNYIERNIPVIKKRLRYSLSYRNVGYSRALNKAVHTELYYANLYPNINYTSDFLKGFDEILKADYIHYVDYPAAIYRLNVGVTSIQKEKSRWIQHDEAYKIIAEKYKSIFDQKDILFIKYIRTANNFKINPSAKNFFICLYFYLRNMGNFGYNNPAIRNMHYLLPLNTVSLLKKNVYPIFLKFRETRSKK